MSKAPETIYIDQDGVRLGTGAWGDCRVKDSDLSYVRGDIAYGYASEVEKLLALQKGLSALAERMRKTLDYQEAIALTSYGEGGYVTNRNLLEEIEALMTAHQIETMARDALTKET